MRSIFVLLILVMIGLNGKGQSVTALPDSVLSQCCLEVTLLNGNVTTVDWVFIQYIARDGSGTKLFVEYAPNFGGIQWETQIRIQDDFDDVIERSKFIILPFTVGSTDYGIHRNWIANIEENTTTGGTWIYGRFGTPTKRKFSAVEDYETLKNLLLACRPRAIVVAENGLYTEGDTVRMGGFLIENTSITTEGYNWQMKDTLSSAEFGLDYLTPETGDTTVYWGRRSGSLRQMVQMGNRYYYNVMKDTVGGLYSDFTHSWSSGDPYLKYVIFNPLAPNSGTAWMQIQRDNSFLLVSNETTNPFYTLGWTVTSTVAQLGANESGSGDPGNGVVMGAYGFGTTEFLFMRTKAVDNNTAANGQFLQLIDNSSGEVDFATIDLSAYLPIADTAAMLDPYIQGAGTINRVPIFTGSRVIGNSNIQDNNTAVSILSSKPFMLGQWTTAGRPTGTSGYMGYNTTLTGIDWYNGTRWATGLESTFARGTATRVPFFDANGQVTDDAGIVYDGTNDNLGLGGSPAAQIDMQGNKSRSNWGENGISLRIQPATYTNTSSSGTIPFLTSVSFGQPTFIASSPTTVTNLSSIYIQNSPGLGGNITATNSWALYVRAGKTYFGGNVTFAGAISFPTWNWGATNISQVIATTQAPSVNSSLVNIQNGQGGLSHSSTLHVLSVNNSISGQLGSITNFFHANPTINLNANTTSGAIIRGFYYNPTLTNLRTAQNRAFESTTGDVIFGSNTANLSLGNSLIVSQTGDSVYIKDRIVFPSGRVNTQGATPEIGYSIGNEPGSIMFGGAIRTNVQGFTAYPNILIGRQLAENALTSGGRLMLFGDAVLNGASPAFNVVAIGTQLADFSAATGSDFFIGGSVSVRYATNLDRSVIVSPRAFNRTSGVNLEQTVSFGYGNGNTMTERSVGGTHLGYQQAQQLVYGDQISTYGYQAGNTIKRGTNLSFIGNYTGATDTMFNNASAIGNYAAIGQSESIAIGAINGVNSATYDAKIGIGTTTPDEKLHVVGAVKIEGLVTAKQEAYYEINSTSSPQTFSNTYSDNYVNQGSTQASFTFLFPASPEDGQILMITWGNAISVVTLDGNGNTITGTAVTTATAGTRRMFKFYGSSNEWVKIF